MSKLVMRLLLVVLGTAAFSVTSQAQAPCQILARASLYCNGNPHCQAPAYTTYEGDSGICGAFIGQNYHCPGGTCGGEEIDSASAVGTCLGHAGCDYGDAVVIATEIMQQYNIGKAYVIGCRGEVRVLLRGGRTHPIQSASVSGQNSSLQQRSSAFHPELSKASPLGLTFPTKAVTR